MILVRRTDSIITVAAHLGAYLRDILGEDGRASSRPISVVYNAVRPIDVPPLSKEAYKSRLGLTGFVTSFVGGLRGVYAVDDLLGAAREFVSRGIGMTFTVVGGGGEERSALNERIRELGLSDSVRLIPQVTNRVALEYIKASDVLFAVYSSADGNARVALPWKVSESMACGTPVMVREGSFAWRFVSEHGTGFSAKSSTPDSIFDELYWAYTHKKDLDSLGDRARKVFAESFNWESTSSAFLKAYDAA
jgi:glycosyltransferase involved in cell wall biosynthesis